MYRGMGVRFCNNKHYQKTPKSMISYSARGGSRNSDKSVHMYRGVGIRFVDFVSYFLNIP